MKNIFCVSRNMYKNDKGLITLEACITVITFMILMFVLFGIFIMFAAQSTMAHTLLQTTQSLALDAYTTSRFQNRSLESDSATNRFLSSLFLEPSVDNPHFTSDTTWYYGDGHAIAQVARLRFIGYLAGGNEVTADTILRSFRIKGGLDGLDFTNSTVVNNDLHIRVDYTIKFFIQMWGLTEIDVRQESISRLWLARDY